MPKAKPPSPEVAALIPDGIDKFVPRCVVCTKPVPANRARGRSKDTCGPDCHAVLRLYRKFTVQTSKCIACYHPSTEAERLDFKRWRQARGKLREFTGRPPVKMRQALTEAVAILEEYLAPDDHYLLFAIARFNAMLYPRTKIANTANEIRIDAEPGNSLGCELSSTDVSTAVHGE